jgi:hypothetical protein
MVRPSRKTWKRFEFTLTKHLSEQITETASTKKISKARLIKQALKAYFEQNQPVANEVKKTEVEPQAVEVSKPPQPGTVYVEFEGDLARYIRRVSNSRNISIKAVAKEALEMHVRQHMHFVKQLKMKIFDAVWEANHRDDGKAA